MAVAVTLEKWRRLAKTVSKTLLCVAYKATVVGGLLSSLASVRAKLAALVPLNPTALWALGVVDAVLRDLTCLDGCCVWQSPWPACSHSSSPPACSRSSLPPPWLLLRVDWIGRGRRRWEWGSGCCWTLVVDPVVEVSARAWEQLSFAHPRQGSAGGSLI
jgi:hypothetical protein